MLLLQGATCTTWKMPMSRHCCLRAYQVLQEPSHIEVSGQQLLAITCRQRAHRVQHPWGIAQRISILAVTSRKTQLKGGDRAMTGDALP